VEQPEVVSGTMTRNPAMRTFYLVVAIGVVLFDRLAKWLVATHISLHDTIDIIPGFFRLTHLENSGAAFGLFADSPSQWKLTILVVFSLVALAVVTVLLWKNSYVLTSTGVGLALILGGAIGNLWDRVIDGHVVDFLLFYVKQYQWPAFNVADSAIVVGALLLVAEILFSKPAPSEQVVTR